jgi:hypothetical protein
VIVEPTPQTSSTPAGANAATPASGRLEILSHHTKGRSLTTVVQVPGADKLAAGGTGVRSLRREVAKSERVSLSLVLTRAGAASLHKHHRLGVTVRVSFKQTSGPSSSANVRVAFR